MSQTRITVAHGDGIGPEIMDATLKILDAAGADLAYDTIDIGEKVYLKGLTAGISDESWDILRENKVFLKAPITTPQGGGYKSLNVTVRKSLGLYANVRPCQAFVPYVHSHFPEMDLVIVRENEEDLYAGIEHRQTEEVYQCLKLVTRPGCEKIIRYAFEYAKQYGRKKVTCMSKDNIMKLTDGLFHDVFNEVRKEYPDIESDHYIIDIGSARLADTPERFDVIVTLNLYGDIISDIAAQISGSVGLGGSSNVGDGFAMFEAIHGSAPDISGQDIANPSGLINGAILMLLHLGKGDVAAKIHNALMVTLEDGTHTADIWDASQSKSKVGTKEFAEAVISNLGKVPTKLKKADFPDSVSPIEVKLKEKPKQAKTLVGVDAFIDWDELDRNPDVLGEKLQKASKGHLIIKMITNRGVKVWPNGLPETFKTDHWRCRFWSKSNHKGQKEGLAMVTNDDILELLKNIADEGCEVIKTENLYTYEGALGYSLGQGE
ncbi:MAG: NADP-dependent isocitrate dehydrogenase [Candidatus Kapaibacteriales bacterium]